MLFRRLGGAQASDLIRAAVCTTYREWASKYGALPSEVMRTEIDPRKVLSRNPGYSYMMAGFHNKRVVRGKIYLDAPCPTLLAAGSCACCPGSLLQSMVAALYIDPRGPYPKMKGVDCWDAERDARNYDGPYPVVAHPPCGPWGKLAHMCTKQDPELALLAVEQVRRWGGVLEHPQASRLWAHCKLPLVQDGTDEYGGFTVDLRQCDWGHVCAKPTWLYIVGTQELPPRPRPGKPRKHVTNSDRPYTRSSKRATAKELILTPPKFAEWLVQIARSVKR